MSLVDKVVFERRGAKGCSDSEYVFSMTTCCERVGIIDHELHQFYWDAESTDRSVNLFEEPPCPFCGASAWGLYPLEEPEQVPQAWRWTCTSQRQGGSRRARPLAQHVRELLAFCQRLAAPVPAFDTTLFVDTSDPRVRHSGGWVLPPGALLGAAEFAPHFDRLLAAGYAWLNLSALGIFQNALVIGLERPHQVTGVAAGLTAVNYSGPLPTAEAPGPTPVANWDLQLTLSDHLADTTNTFTGGCHCGNLSYVLESRSGDLALRACDCSFCRLHGTIGAAPLDGRLQILVARPEQLQRYRFGSCTADVVLCTQCGVSIGVVAEIEGSSYAVVNARTLAGVTLPDALPRLSVGDETVEARAARRRAGWIPEVQLREPRVFRND